jgi:hypothetical protein
MKTQALPRAPQEVTAEWLTQALHARGGISADSRVGSVRSETSGEGTGFLGQLARFSLTYAAGEGPAVLIGKFPTLDPGGRAIGNLFRFYEREVRFYDEVATDISLTTPRCYYSAANVADDEYLLLLEDLAPARCGDQIAGASVEDAETAIRSIADFHATWWDNDRCAALEWLPLVNAPVHQSAQQSYRDAWPLFSDAYLDRLAPPMQRTAEEMRDHVIDLLNVVSVPPRTIIHGDFRVDNMFFAAPGSRAPFSVIDWQISSQGRGVFDVAYFLSGGVEPDVRKTHEMRLLRMWHDMLVERGVKGYTWDDAVRDYRICVLYCLVYVVISLGTLDTANPRGVALFDAWLRRSTTAIEELDAAEMMPRST